MARVVWSAPARQDLRAILAYIAADSPAYARAFVARLRHRVPQLERFPDSGRPVPEDLTQTYRELIHGSYRLIYRRDGDLVTIITLIHGARMLRL